MKNIREISDRIFNISEDIIYEIIEKFDKMQNIDKSLTYIYIKAFYIHCVKMYLSNLKKIEKFEDIYSEYKNCLINYYKTNNVYISEELIKDIADAFDKSFEMMESLGFQDIESGYEFRHHIIMSFELLRQILEKKSKCEIRIDIFENYISKFKSKSEEILDYIKSI